MPNIITPEAILSYPNLFTPRAAAPDSDPKYSASFVFEEETDLSELKRTVLEVVREQWGDDLEGASLSTLETQHGPATFLVADELRLRIPWYDQESVITGKGYPEGSTYINARSGNPPGVVSRIADPNNDGKPAPIVSPSGDVRLADGTVIPQAQEVYAGARARDLLSVYAYDTQGNRGVSFGLSGVQVMGDGERLDGRANAEDMFDADQEATVDLEDLTEPVGADAGEEDDLIDRIG